jgi:hypothetical protein
MTMDHMHHPDDERLAAYADAPVPDEGSADVGAHVAACGRCRRLVDDLRTLRASLAELPDVAPSRPLRFLPPVAPAPVKPAGFGDLVRRLFAPAMIAGGTLVLVGSVGMAATPGGLASMSGGAAQEGADNGVGGGAPAAPSAGGEETYVLTASPAAEGVANPDSRSGEPAVAGASDAAASEAGGRSSSTGDGSETSQLTLSAPMLPWMAMTIAGGILLILSLLVRWTFIPRAPHPPAYPGA